MITFCLSYMYAKVDKSRYQKVTGNARAAILCGRFIASVLSQVLFSYNVMDIRQLNYLTLGGDKNSHKLLSFSKAFLLF